MEEESVGMDPWGSNQSTDYARIIDQFGLSSLSGLDLPAPTELHRGGIVFAHRNLDVILALMCSKDDIKVTMSEDNSSSVKFCWSR